MNRTQKKKLTLFSLLGVSTLAITLSVAFAANGGMLKPLSASDCKHETVEHYVGHSDTVTGAGYVEHWACCQCHTAWADETRLVELGNTVSDRKLIDTDTGMKVNWGASMATPTYDLVNGQSVFTDSNFSIAQGGGSDDPYYFIEFVTTRTLKSDEYVKLSMLNMTDASSLNVDIRDASWAQLYFGAVSCAKDTAKELKISAEQWNTKLAFIIKEPSKTATSGTFKFAVQFAKLEEKVITNCAINSNYNGWAEFTTTEDTDTFGKVVVADLSEITEGGQFVYNGVQAVDPSLYSKVHFGIYNPTSNTIDANMRTVTSGWGLLYQEVKTIVPGWNDIYVNPDILSYHDVNMITVDISDYTQWKASGWKLSQFIGKLASQTRLSSLAINSDLTGWASFTEKRMDETFGEVTVCDLSSATGKFALVWNGCPIHTVGEYDKYYFAINNPTENTFAEISFNAADSGWGTLMTKYHITIEPGWNKIGLPAAFFEVAGLSMYSINISADMGPQWANAGWEISNFFGLK